MSGTPLSTLAWKEMRALLPVWCGTLVAVVAAGMAAQTSALGPLRWSRPGLLGILAYGFGVITLGAQSVGHEYTHGTLAALLTTPFRRRHTYAVKLGVASMLILSLTAVALTLNISNGAPLTLVLPTAGALLLAPWLTMICRSPLAGTVFTIAVPAVLFVAAQVIANQQLGPTRQAADFARTLWLGAAAALGPIGGVLGWRHFMRLEALEGPRQPVSLPAWFRRRTAVRAPRPVTTLIRKEIALHQIAFVIAALYVCAWAAIFPLGVLPEAPGRTMTLMPITVIYFVILSALVGSLTSAEERNHGTREWQLTLPVARGSQWIVKIGVALTLALTLGVGLPLVLLSLSATSEELQFARSWWRGMMVPVMVVTTASIYVSSLCSSGLRALALAAPAIGVTVVLLETMSYFLTFGRAILWPRGAVTPGIGLGAVTPVIGLGAVGVVLVSLLWFGFRNHVEAQRTPRRIAGQIATVAAILVAATVLLGPL